MSALIVETSRLPRVSKTACLILLAGLSTSILFFNLGENKLQSWDEAIYAQSAKEMIQTGDWLTPHWNGEKFFQKPPLAIWATALSFRLFGVNEFSARLFSTLCGSGCVLLVFFIGCECLSRNQALTAALILLATPGFYFYAREGITDAPLTLFLLLSLYAYLKSDQSFTWWVAVGTSCGLAVLTKGPATLPVLIAIAFSVLVKRERPWLRREFWIGLTAFVLVGGSWHVMMMLAHGVPFIDQYFGVQILRRGSSAVDAAARGLGFYPAVLAGGVLPFLPFLIVGVFVASRARQLPFVIVAFGVITLLLVSSSLTKHYWYVLPLYPVLALIASYGAQWRGWPIVFSVAWLVGLALCVSVDQNQTPLRAGDSAAVNAAQGSGPIHTSMTNAPAILFYTNRKICTSDTQHSMAPLTKCE